MQDPDGPSTDSAAAAAGGGVAGEHEVQSAVSLREHRQDQQPPQSPEGPAAGTHNHQPTKSLLRESNNFARGSMTFRGSLLAIEELQSAQSIHQERAGIPFHSSPVQRQRWGEDQVLPHVNWGDLFFDLFFVAAAYNLGAMLISALAEGLWFRGITYFVGIFGPLFSIWQNKLIYDARYSVIDYAHRIIDVVRVLCLSFAVLHIKTFEVMSDPGSVSTFCFVLGIFLEIIVEIILLVEIYFLCQGDRTAIQAMSRGLFCQSFVPISLLYLASAIVSGTLLYRERFGNSDASAHSDYGYNQSDYHADKEAGDGHLRFLAASDPSSSAYTTSQDGWSLADLPIALCLIAYLFNNVMLAIRVAMSPGGGEHKKVYVPMNIDFTIHRFGEWIMLMLGESVLSLLIVDVAETRDYYVVAFLGILTVIMMQTLHFESQPSHADGHAMRRNKTAGVAFGIIIQLYSMALIAFGVSYKVMLSTEYSEASDSHRRTSSLLESVTGISAEASEGHRSLAGAVSVPDTTVAGLFSGALAISLASLELMTLTHKGVKTNLDRCYLSSQSHRKLGMHWPCLALAAVKVGLLVFAATLSQWVTDAEWISFAGFFIVLLFIITRIIGWTVINKTNVCQGALNNQSGTALKPEDGGADDEQLNA